MNAVFRTFARRTLANVLLDIKVAERDRDYWDRACQRAVEGSPEEDAASDRFGEADDRLLELRNEAARVIAAATGVSWDQISEANL